MRSKVVTSFILLSLLTMTAWAIDLTGTWEGKQVCQYFDGRKSVVIDDDELQVTQNGDELYFSSVLVHANFHAQVIEDARHPQKSAQAVFVECGTTESSTYQELGRATNLQVISKKEGALFDAESNFFQLEDDGFRFMGTCKWKYRRVNTTNPNIESCSAAAVKVPQARRPKR